MLVPALSLLSSIRSAFELYAQRSVLTVFILGFSSGLPLMLVFGVLSFWLREAGVSREQIGYFSWVVMAYAIKLFWSPLVDHCALPFLNKLGRRRSWLAASQCIIIVAIMAMASTDPQQQLHLMAAYAIALAIASATQDIAIDAYRIESAPGKQQAALAASYLAGYRLAMIFSSAGTLWLAAWFGGHQQNYQLTAWKSTYLVMAGFMLLALLNTLLSPEPQVQSSEVEASVSARTARLQEWLNTAIIGPFLDFFRRNGWNALLILSLIASYRITDVVMGVMANVFYVDMGFSKEEVASVSKVFGVIMTLVGAAVGGVLINSFGILRILLLGAVLSALTNLLFSYLSTQGHQLNLLIGVISMDNLSAGIATSAFIAYLSSLVNLQYTATQYALFSSLMLLLPKFLGGFSGGWVEVLDYDRFFMLTALMGLPAILLCLWLIKKTPQ
ncbi:AmpG family muropeptide MFS transporter [Rheinheimera sp.]|uniref:AmpG family muropeptide MFS transporter n=1 Tax=Rheinheimera sp. TaxID=1869214 RepID=UPI003AF911ED